MKTLHFLCSPSLGILDNWLPVLTDLKNKSPSLRFALVIPKAGIVGHISEAELTIIFSRNIFSEIIFLSNYGQWIKSPTIEEAVLINSRTKGLEIFLSSLDKIQRLSGLRLRKTIESYFRERESGHLGSKIINIESELMHSSGILFDVVEESKSYNSFLVNLPHVKKFSLCHGININTDPIIRYNYRERKPQEVTAFLFSEAEKTYYVESFNLGHDNLRIIGIPRHEPQWIEHILKESSRYHLPPEGDYVFLISRPASPYLPSDRKRKALQDIRKVIIEEMGLKVLVKTHPKEKVDKLFEEVFGSHNLNRTWFQTHAHPFIAGKSCRFAVSFYSGVATDMTALGKATIEYLDLRSIPEYDHGSAHRDHDGHPVLSYRQLGLVLGVSEENQLRKAVDKVMKDPGGVIAELKTKYSHFFGSPQGAVGRMSNEILMHL